MANQSNKENKDFNKQSDQLLEMLNDYYNNKRKKEWAEALEKDHSIVRDKLYRPRLKLLGFISSIAAALIVLILMNTFIRPFGSDVPELADNMLQSTPLTISSDINVRGHGTDSEQSKDIQNALESKNYEEAIRLYRLLQPGDTLALSDKFYYGVSLIKADKGNLENAIELLSEVSGKKNAFELDARWFLALAYIKNDDFPKGKEQLLLLNEKSKYQEKNVKKLLKKINK